MQKLEREVRVCRMLKHENIGTYLFSYYIARGRSRNIWKGGGAWLESPTHIMGYD